MALKFFIISIILFTAFNFIFLNFSLAEDSAQSNVSCSENKEAYPWCNTGTIGGESGLINKFYNYALALVGVTALGAIIFGGVKYTISAGNPSAQADAISWITGAVWGLILLLGANLLLRTINPQIVELKLADLEVVEIKVDNHTYKTEVNEAAKCAGTSPGNCEAAGCILEMRESGNSCVSKDSSLLKIQYQYEGGKKSEIELNKAITGTQNAICAEYVKRKADCNKFVGIFFTKYFQNGKVDYDGLKKAVYYELIK